jgi:threonine/homoserine/homoserine lactone efflux protein
VLSKNIASVVGFGFSGCGLAARTIENQMDHHFLLRGLVVGFSIAAPVGPIGVLCIRRTLAEGRLAGFACGLGAATADACYGAVAAFGLTAVSSLLVSHQSGLRLVGGLFLCYLGIQTFLTRPAGEAAQVRSGSLSGAYLSTIVLTLTNPMTILSFAGVFAGLGLGSGTGDYPAAAFLIAGVFIGSAAWWLLLSGGVGLFREKLDAQHLRWVNRFSGLIIAAFGLACLAALVS